MFSSNETWVTILGVVLSLGVIFGLVWYVNKSIKNTIQDRLVVAVVNVFTALVGVWVADKVVAFKINLLSEKQSDQVFELIKELTLMIFTYHFLTVRNNQQNKNL